MALLKFCRNFIVTGIKSILLFDCEKETETDGFVSNYFITTYFTTVIIIMSDIYDLIYVTITKNPTVALGHELEDMENLWLTLPIFCYFFFQIM